jgi:catalase
MKAQKKLTTAAVAPVVDNQNTMTAGPRGPICCKMSGLEKLGHFDREAISEQQQALFENTARALDDSPEEVKVRHIRNCLKADKAW